MNSKLPNSKEENKREKANAYPKKPPASSPDEGHPLPNLPNLRILTPQLLPSHSHIPTKSNSSYKPHTPPYQQTISARPSPFSSSLQNSHPPSRTSKTSLHQPTTKRTSHPHQQPHHIVSQSRPARGYARVERGKCLLQVRNRRRWRWYVYREE